jgi:hypothetical protein
MKRSTVVATDAQLADRFFPESLGRRPHSPRKRLHNPALKGGSSSTAFQRDKEEHVNFLFHHVFFVPVIA